MAVASVVSLDVPKKVKYEVTNAVVVPNVVDVVVEVSKTVVVDLDVAVDFDVDVKREVIVPLDVDVALEVPNEVSNVVENAVVVDLDVLTVIPPLIKSETEGCDPSIISTRGSHHC